MSIAQKRNSLLDKIRELEDVKKLNTLNIVIGTLYMYDFPGYSLAINNNCAFTRRDDAVKRHPSYHTKKPYRKVYISI